MGATGNPPASRAAPGAHHFAAAVRRELSCVSGQVVLHRASFEPERAVAHRGAQEKHDARDEAPSKDDMRDVPRHGPFIADVNRKHPRQSRTNLPKPLVCLRVWRELLTITLQRKGRGKGRRHGSGPVTAGKLRAHYPQGEFSPYGWMLYLEGEGREVARSLNEAHAAEIVRRWNGYASFDALLLTLSLMADRWDHEQTEYPEGVGDHAAAAVRICARDIRAAIEQATS